MGCTRSPFSGGLQCCAFCTGPVNPDVILNLPMFRLKADSQASYDRFVRRVVEAEVVWGLLSSEGWAVCPSNEYEDTSVFPFWSDEAYAKAHCIEDWSSYRPEAIDLESFIDNWLRGMNEDGSLLGPNWNSALAGMEVEPIEVAKRLIGVDE